MTDEQAIEAFGAGSQHVVEQGRVVECMLDARTLIAEGPRLFGLGLARVRLWDGKAADVEKICALSGLQAVRALEFPEQMVTEKGARALAACAALGTLERLSLHTGSLGEKGLDALLAAFPRLRSLSLVHMRLPAAAGEKLAAAALPDLRALDLSENQLGDDGAAALAALKTPLESLKLAENKIGDAGAAALAGAPFAASLQVLDLSTNPLRDAGVAALAAAFPRLTELTLSSVKFGAKGAAALAGAVHQIGQLDLSMTSLKPKDWAVFAANATARAFDQVNLTSMKLDDAGAAALAGWSGLDRCKALDLGHNQLTAKGLAALLSRDLRALTELSLNHNPLGAAAGAALGAAAPRLPALQTLSLRQCELGDAGVLGLLPLTQLDTLTLEDDALMDPGAVALAASAMQLQTLSLHGAPLTAAGVEALLTGKGLPRLAYLFVNDSAVAAQERPALQKLADQRKVVLRF